MPAPAPRTIGRYVVLGEVEHEGPARELLAFDPELGRQIRLRLLPQGDPASGPLLDEARRQGRLRHPGVLAVCDSGISEAGIFIALEHAQGGSLEDWLAAAPRSGQAILRCFVLVGDALAAAHAAGLAHGRMGAAAVLLASDGTPRIDGLRAAAPGDAAEDQRALCAALAAALVDPPASKALRRALRRGQHPDPARRFPDLAALAGALRRAGAPTWGRWRALAAGLLLVPLGALLHPAQAPPCGGSERHLSSLIGEEPRAARRAAFLRSGRAGAAEALRQVEETLAGFPGRWAVEARAACEDARRQGQAADAVGLRQGCLQRAAGEVRALAEVLAAADGDVVDRAPQVTRELTDLRVCRDLQALRLRWAPRDPARRPVVDALRARLLRQRVLLSAGSRQEALRLAEESVADAERVGFTPLLVEALVRSGQARLSLGDPRGAESALLRAVNLAERDRYDTALAVAMEMLMHAADLRDVPAEREDFARWAAAAIERCDVCSPLWPNWHRKRGNALLSQGRYREAAAAYERALPAFDVPAEGSVDLHNNLGLAYLHLGELDRALGELQRSLRMREAALGPGHAAVMSVLDNLAEALDRLGHFPAALRAAEREVTLVPDEGARTSLGSALINRGRARCRLGRLAEGLADLARGAQLLEAALGAEHPDLAAALTAQGEALVRAGRVREALSPLERAVRIAVRRDHPAQGAALAVLGGARLALGDPAGAGLLDSALAQGAPWVLPPAVEGAARVRLARTRLPAHPADARAQLQRALRCYEPLGQGYAADREEARVLLSRIGGASGR